LCYSLFLGSALKMVNNSIITIIKPTMPIIDIHCSDGFGTSCPAVILMCVVDTPQIMSHVSVAVANEPFTVTTAVLLAMPYVTSEQLYMVLLYQNTSDSDSLSQE